MAEIRRLPPGAGAPIFQLSRLSYYADFALAPLCAVACMVAVIWRGSFAAFALFAPLGLFAWTFIEYALHRWAFHELPSLAREHVVHHRWPAYYIGVAPLGTASSFFAVGALLWLLFGEAAAGLLFGLLAGYTFYIVVHDAFHHRTIGPRHVLYGIKMRHVAHHRGARGNYGVSSPLWDFVFGTIVKSGPAL